LRLLIDLVLARTWRVLRAYGGLVGPGARMVRGGRLGETLV
jgi:hypothetical protein